MYTMKLYLCFVVFATISAVFVADAIPSKRSVFVTPYLKCPDEKYRDKNGDCITITSRRSVFVAPYLKCPDGKYRDKNGDCITIPQQVWVKNPNFAFDGKESTEDSSEYNIDPRRRHLSDESSEIDCPPGTIEIFKGRCQSFLFRRLSRQMSPDNREKLHLCPPKSMLVDGRCVITSLWQQKHGHGQGPGYQYQY